MQNFYTPDFQLQMNKLLRIAHLVSSSSEFLILCSCGLIWTNTLFAFALSYTSSGD